MTTEKYSYKIPDYSSLRDINIGAWIQEALDNGYRLRVIEEFQIL